MEKRFIKNGEQVFATGVYLVRDNTAPGGWRVDGFEDETFFDGDAITFQDDDDFDSRYYVEEYSDITKAISKDDIIDVGLSIKIYPTDEELLYILRNYDGAQADDPTSNWSEVVETMLYDRINDRKDGI